MCHNRLTRVRFILVIYFIRKMSKHNKFPTLSNQKQNSTWRATDCSLVSLALCSRPFLSCEQPQSHYRIIPRSVVSDKLMMISEQRCDWLKVDAVVPHFCSYPPKILWLSWSSYFVVYLGSLVNGRKNIFFLQHLLSSLKLELENLGHLSYSFLLDDAF